jgi:hypothetical protein
VTARGRRPLRGSRRGREGSPSADCGVAACLAGSELLLCAYAEIRGYTDQTIWLRTFVYNPIFRRIEICLFTGSSF